ncbi:hypothetical protein [Methylobacterium longum]|uniref:Uncharacterized protein n=1 Tax=Methylobacterium longum TaxID=767694 RepID=A0ABT8AMW6_9HYPH|nr:hypothetical protein [Methylobacterium longum]MDN3571129.1 hypothetical protein [Methylobacterium longum]
MESAATDESLHGQPEGPNYRCVRLVAIAEQIIYNDDADELAAFTRAILLPSRTTWAGSDHTAKECRAAGGDGRATASSRDAALKGLRQYHRGSRHDAPRIVGARLMPVDFSFGAPQVRRLWPSSASGTTTRPNALANAAGKKRSYTAAWLLTKNEPSLKIFCGEFTTEVGKILELIDHGSYYKRTSKRIFVQRAGAVKADRICTRRNIQSKC